VRVVEKPESGGMVSNLFLATASAALLALRTGLMYDLGKEVKMSKFREGEEPFLIGLDVPGLDAVEDLVVWKEGVAFGGSGNVNQCFEEGPENVEQGFIVLVDVRDGPPRVSRIKTTGTPGGDWRFHPHGIFYSELTKRLYVVNHGGAKGVGSRIEMFDVIETDDNTPELKWKMSIGGKSKDGEEAFGNMVINSVVETSPSEIYVTQFLSFPLPVNGTEGDATLEEKAKASGNMVIAVLNAAGLGGVHRCVFDEKNKETEMCEMVISGTVSANGITTSADRSIVYVADTIRKEVMHFDRNSKTGALTENKAKLSYSPHGIDNIHMDFKTGQLWMGTIPYLHEFTSNKAAGAFTVGDLGGDQRFTFSDYMVHDGELLSKISACLKLSTPETFMSYLICGSFKNKGILVVPYDEKFGF